MSFASCISGKGEIQKALNRNKGSFGSLAFWLAKVKEGSLWAGVSQLCSCRVSYTSGLGIFSQGPNPLISWRVKSNSIFFSKQFPPSSHFVFGPTSHDSHFLLVLIKLCQYSKSAYRFNRVGSLCHKILEKQDRTVRWQKEVVFLPSLLKKRINSIICTRRDRD